MNKEDIINNKIFHSTAIMAGHLFAHMLSEAFSDVTMYAQIIKMTKEHEPDKYKQILNSIAQGFSMNIYKNMSDNIDENPTEIEKHLNEVSEIFSKIVSEMEKEDAQIH